MAYIESFTVTGLAGRDVPVSRTLDRHVNVFWGLNGSGKTSLLKILNSALRGEVASLTHIAFSSAEVTICTNTGAKVRRSLVNGADNLDESPDESDGDDAGTTLEPLGDGLWQEVTKNAAREWDTKVLREGSNRLPRRHYESVSFKHTYLPISRVSATRTAGPQYFGSDGPPSSYRQAFNDAHLSELFAEQVRTKWQTYHSDALSSIRRVQQQGLATILAVLFGGAVGHAAQLEPTDSGSDAYELVTSFLREQSISLRVGEDDFKRRYDQASELRRVVANIQDVTVQVEEILRPQREFQSIIDDLYSGGKHIEFEETSLASLRRRRNPLQVKVGDKLIPLQSLSSGEKQLLQLMLETLAADDSTVMIDEPELSMHVDWQQMLIHSMQRVNPHCQLLLATHSPEVMAEISDSYVFEL